MGWPIRALSQWALWAVLILGCWTAAAQSTPAAAGEASENERVVVLSVSEQRDGWHEAELRTQDELRAAGFDVSFVSLPAEVGEEPSLSWVLTQLDSHGAAAAIRVRRLSSEEALMRAPVVIYALDRGTRRIHRIEPEPRRHLPARGVALLAVELLYAARIVPIRAPPPAEPPPPPLVEKPEPVATPVWALRAAPSLQWADGGLGAVGGVSLGAAWLPARLLGVELQQSLGVLPKNVSSIEGQARVGMLHSRVAGLLRFNSDGWISTTLAIGAGWLAVWGSGEARAPYSAETDWGGTAVLSGELALAFALSPSLRLRTAAAGAHTLRSLAIRFEDNVVAKVQGPVFEGSVGVQWLLGGD